MLDSFVKRVTRVFSGSSSSEEDPEMLKGMVDDLEDDLDQLHVEYGNVMSELNDRLQKIRKAKDGDVDKASLLKSEEKVEERMDRYERDHLEAVNEVVGKISKARARLDIVASREDGSPFSRFNYDSHNDWVGMRPTRENVTEFIKSLSPDYLRRVYGDDPLRDVHFLTKGEYYGAISTLSKAVEGGKLEDISPDLPVRLAGMVQLKGRGISIYAHEDDIEGLTKSQKNDLLVRADLMETQRDMEGSIEKGDPVVARWIGSATGAPYESDRLRVREIRDDSLVLEFSKAFPTDNPEADHFVFLKGDSIEVPRVHSYAWNVNNSISPARDER